VQNLTNIFVIYLHSKQRSKTVVKEHCCKWSGAACHQINKIA